jgi:hypothetical protein
MGPGKCKTKWCHGRRPRGSDGYYRSLCHKCHSRLLAQRHPATYVLNRIRQGAKRRKIPCTLTLSQFRRWCEETGYLELKGRLSTSATIDRIDSSRGYSIDNIRILSFYENSYQGRDNRRREQDPF